MSTDFIALFDASSEAVTPEALLAKVMAEPTFGAEIVDDYGNLWLSKAWLIESSSMTGQPELLGPGGFAIRVAPGIIELYHMMPFRIFTSDPKRREALRRSCWLLATFVGSTRAIYTHELIPYDGKGLDQIEGGLRAWLGPPASTFEELRDAEYYGPRSWYIDTFADLSAKSG